MALSLKILPLSHTQIGFVCASQHVLKVITLSIFGRHQCHSLFSPHFPTFSLSQDSEARKEEAKMGQQVTKQKYLFVT